MRIPARRNRNIGTARQGHGQDNRMGYIRMTPEGVHFLENLGPCEQFPVSVQGHEILILREKLRKGYVHPSTPEDLIRLLHGLPPEIMEGMRWIVLRQPKHKEALLEPVWGRLQYSYMLAGEVGAAMMLESVKPGARMRISRSLGPGDAEVIPLLRQAGFVLQETRRDYTCTMEITAARNMQLYYTFLHEWGHYVHYLEQVRWPEMEAGDQETGHWDLYRNLPLRERETFAHQWAMRMQTMWRDAGWIPFDSGINPLISPQP